MGNQFGGFVEKKGGFYEPKVLPTLLKKVFVDDLLGHLTTRDNLSERTLVY
jgi:hypothetical protein